MIERPATRYAVTDGIHLAYQVFGEGPDLALSFPAASHVEMTWDEPTYARWLRRLGSFARVILFDRRGSGVSDRVPLPTLDEEGPDLLAILDEVGAARPFLFGAGPGVAFSLFFAATYPDRTRGVVAWDGAARGSWATDYPWGTQPDAIDAVARVIGSGSMSGDNWAQLMAPSRADDPVFVGWLDRTLRSSLAPAGLEQMVRTYAKIDIRPILPTISVPTLVLHRTGDRLFNVDEGRYLAENIPGARFEEVPGEDYLFFCDGDVVLDRIEEFVTGTPPAPRTDRVLATVLFTDFVDSTRMAAEHGDKRWREILDRHDDLVAMHLDRFNGSQVKTTGDGVLATFDGPARAVRCGCAIRDAMRTLGIELRSGVHTGEIEVRGDDVSGIAVHIGQRVQALAQPGEVLASRTVTDLVAGSGLQFDDRGEHALKGVPGRWHLYAVRSASV